MRIWCVWLCVCFILSCHRQPDRQQGQVENQLVTSQKLSYVKRVGSPYERGIQYGAALKADIQGQLSIWAELCQEEIGMSQEELYNLLLEKTGFIDAIKKYAPEVLEELQGIAQGAEVRVQNLICLNLAEETIIYFTQGYQSCTNIGLQTDRANAIAYNLDLPEFLRKFKPVVLQDDAQFVYAFPGLVAAGGMNKNFLVTTNSLSSLNMDLNGLPLPFMIRKLLQFSNEAQAIQFLKSTPFGAPQNLMIVGRTGIWDFECSAKQIVQYKNRANNGIIFHTNDALANTDTQDKTPNETCPRFTYLDSLLNVKKHDEAIGMEVLEAAIKHKASEIRYEGNYFSFIGQYPKGSTQLPTFEVLLPKEDGKKTYLVFDEAQ